MITKRQCQVKIDSLILNLQSIKENVRVDNPEWVAEELVKLQGPLGYIAQSCFDIVNNTEAGDVPRFEM